MDNKNITNEFERRDSWNTERRRERRERFQSVREQRNAEREERLMKESFNDEPKLSAVYSEAEPKPIKKTGGFKRAIAYCLSILMLAGVGFGGGFFGAKYYGSLSPNDRPVERSEGMNVSITSSEDEGVVEAVAKKVLPSVVGITTTEEVRSFFGTQEVDAVGSGVIVDESGYILTNSHVVSDGSAKKISVLLDDKTTVEAKLLWNDADMDLAVIKIDAPNLVAAELGNSDELNIGERAIAIGNPLGLEFNRSVTAGFISGIGRTIQTSNGKIVSDLIQTDAAINQGNSGGPLLNKNGEVIGINSIKIGGNGTEGLGFAIPINVAKEIVQAMITRGDKAPVALGVKVADYNYYKAYFRIEDDIKEGIIIMEVIEGSTADKYGLKKGDIITSIDGKAISSVDNLRTEMVKHSEGDKLTIEFVRDGKADKVDVIVQ